MKESAPGLHQSPSVVWMNTLLEDITQYPAEEIFLVSIEVGNGLQLPNVVVLDFLKATNDWTTNVTIVM